MDDDDAYAGRGRDKFAREREEDPAPGGGRGGWRDSPRDRRSLSPRRDSFRERSRDRGGRFYDDRRDDRRSRSPPRRSSRDRDYGRRRRDSDDYGYGGRSRVPNPKDLKYLVSKRHFKDYMRQQTGVRGGDDPDWDRRYEVYREEFRMQEAIDFFHAHKDEEWFAEKYREPERTFHKERLVAHRMELLEKFKGQLEQGLFDDAIFDASEDITPSAVVEGNGDSKGDKVDEEMMAEDQAAPSSPVTAAVPGPAGAKRPLCWESPEDETDVAHKVFIRSVPVNVTRKTLEDELATACSNFPPTRLALSDPNPSKKFVRLGWIVFPAETSSADALTALTGFKVGENEYAFAAHSLHPPRTRFVHAEFGKAERIVKDLEQATAVAIAMDAEFGIDGLAAVDNRASTLAMGLDEEVANKKKLDMVLTYLRRVHLWDYYSGMGADSVEDFSRKFPPNLRARGPLEMEPSADEFAWKKASEKVDLRARYFGKLLTDEELAKLDWRDPEQHAKSKMRSFMKEEGEFRFRCLVEDCGKLFKAAEFVEKHLLNKHPNVQTLVDAARAEAEYANAYVRDPCKITVVRESQERPQRPPPRNKPISSRIGGRDEGFEAPPPMPIMLGRMDRRQLRDYTDLDAIGPPAAGDMDISYD